MISPFPTKARAAEIEEKAAEWIVVVGQQAGQQDAPEKRAQLEAWLNEDPRHRAAYLRLEAVWRKTGRLKALRALDGTVDKDLLKGGARREGVRERRVWAAAAAAAVLFVTAGVATWMKVSERPWQTHVTEEGGFARITLKDGSSVDLNSASEIRVRFTDSRRDVLLGRGEGHFGVARDARRPFVVEAGGQSVRAVGTAFTVRLHAARQIEVLVTEGRVAVGSEDSLTPGPSPGGRGERAIAAGEAAMVEDGLVTVRQVQAGEVSRQLAWAAGRLYFEGDTLGEAVAQFNRYTTRKLVVEGDDLARLRIGGNFRATDVDGFVGALEDSFGVQAQMSDEGTVRLVRPHR